MDIDIKDLDKAEVLQALFNRSRQQGMGFIDSSGAAQMTLEDAEEIVKQQGDRLSFDYLRGRVMKVEISGDILRPHLFDRDNGVGAAAAAIDTIR